MIITRTPLRISFFGGGSDLPSYFQNNVCGRVLCATIDKYNYVCIADTYNKSIRLVYQDIADYDDVEDIKNIIVKEVLQAAGMSAKRGMFISSLSDVSGKGSGLGSSSAFTVGLLRAILYPTALPTLVAEAACHIEVNLCKFPIGYQDQYAAAYGGFNMIEFHQNGQVEVQPLEMSLLDKLHDNLVMIYTGIQRDSIDILSKQNQMMLDNATDKIGIIRTFTEYAVEAESLLANGETLEFGRMLDDAWQLKRTLVSNITSQTIDDFYDKAKKCGAVGAKMLGAGGGGHMLFVVPNTKKNSLVTKMSETFPQIQFVPFKFTDKGSTVIE